LYYWIVHFLRIPMVYYLLFSELQIKSYDFSKTWINSDLKNLFEFYFDPRLATWRFLIGGYLFGWISSAVRWIKRWLDALDRSVPIRLSESIWSVRSKSDGREESGRESHRLGFPAGRRRRGLIQALDDGDGPVVPGGDGGADGVRNIKARAVVETVSSTVSSSEGEGRLGEARAPVCFCRCRILQDKGKRK
jgi:hypothetical protein